MKLSAGIFIGKEPEIFSKAEAALTKSQAEAVKKCIKLAGINKKEISAIGFHGQTVLHRPANRVLKGADPATWGWPGYGQHA